MKFVHGFFSGRVTSRSRRMRVGIDSHTVLRLHTCEKTISGTRSVIGLGAGSGGVDDWISALNRGLGKGGGEHCSETPLSSLFCFWVLHGCSTGR